MHKVIVVGGGAAGMIAAIEAAKKNNRVILFEKNEKLGKKIYITGKGRCNLTNNVPVREFFGNVVSNPKFLYSCINNFSAQDTMRYFEDSGLRLKVERGNRVFPESDKASDVTKTLEKLLVDYGVEVRYNSIVEALILRDDVILGVKVDGKIENSDSVIVCTGGLSYPLTGSTGDGYRFAKKCGHSLIELKPSLVGIELCGNKFLDMQGLSLKNVTLTAKACDKVLFSGFGEMLFTHYGISGPLVLSCSSLINRRNVNELIFLIDLKPALSKEVLELRLIKEFSVQNVKDVSNVMRSLLPKAIINAVLTQAQVRFSKKCSEITVDERNRIVSALKSLEFKGSSLRPVDEGVVTAGGVCVKEINPKTMESKIVKGLYFAGEVLDVDAFTGGFNLQIAFSTGYAAGRNA